MGEKFSIWIESFSEVRELERHFVWGNSRPPGEYEYPDNVSISNGKIHGWSEQSKHFNSFSEWEDRQAKPIIKEEGMNKNISEVFEKTKDALLVEKHLGSELGNTFIDGLLLQDKKKEVLAEAKRREEAEQDK